jgi:hypothetical protein
MWTTKEYESWTVGGRTRHAATKAMFLRELKEWGLIVVKYLPGSEMCTDLFTKNLPGVIFEKHVKYYMTDDQFKKAKEQQAREAVGSEEKLNFESN